MLFHASYPYCRLNDWSAISTNVNGSEPAAYILTGPGEFFLWTHFRLYSLWREVLLRMRSVNCHGNVDELTPFTLRSTGCLRIACLYCVCVRVQGKMSSRCVSFVFGMWWCTSLHIPLPPAHIHNTVQMARIVMLLGGIARVKGFH